MGHSALRGDCLDREFGFTQKRQRMLNPEFLKITAGRHSHFLKENAVERSPVHAELLCQINRTETGIRGGFLRNLDKASDHILPRPARKPASGKRKNLRGGGDGVSLRIGGAFPEQEFQFQKEFDRTLSRVA